MYIVNFSKFLERSIGFPRMLCGTVLYCVCTDTVQWEQGTTNSTHIFSTWSVVVLHRAQRVKLCTDFQMMYIEEDSGQCSVAEHPVGFLDRGTESVSYISHHRISKVMDV